MKRVKHNKGHITLFEHEKLKIGQVYDGTEYTAAHQEKMEQFYGNKGLPYYSLINKGVQFNEHVGVLSVDGLVIEILPKADRYSKKSEWQSILISMLQAVGAFQVYAPSSSALKTKQNSILDLYFELFVKEVEYLYHKGLVKQYRKVEGNRLALKGSLIFGKHLQKNLVHAERFYVKHNTYDQSHLLHQILYKTLLLLKQINPNAALHSRINNLLLNFPEQKNVKISDVTFEHLHFNRKTEDYRYTIDIARLLLLNYHPDLNKGHNNVLALMFDMNALWEQFVYFSLRKKLSAWKVTAQLSKNFWQSTTGSISRMRPDIVLRKDDRSVVLDTKWKNIGNHNPSPEDLRQMYVYHQYYKAEKVALLYPGDALVKGGQYSESEMECAVIRIPTNKKVSLWQEIITEEVSEWIGL